MNILRRNNSICEVRNCHISETEFFSTFYTFKKEYRTRAIITRGLYILNPLFKGQKRVFKELFFRKILALCTVGIQERVMMACVQYLKKVGWLESSGGLL